MSDIKKIKPSLSKGTRDFLPREVAKRNYIFDTIKSVFRKYGFEEIETPAIEKLETLTGKYGEEGDKLLFKILNSGNPLGKLDEDDIEIIRKSIHQFLKLDPTGLLKSIQPGDPILGGNSPEILWPTPNYGPVLNKLSEKGLRYDLTVPLARYAVMYQDKLAFPFKRFHIGPVWRADRPQKGRYQEFYQCDADIIGSTSLLNEVELTKIYLEVFKALNVSVTVQINNRKILWGLAQAVGASEQFEDFIQIMDKYEKIGRAGVKKELIEKNIKSNNSVSIDDFLFKIEHLRVVWHNSDSWENLKDDFQGILSSYGGLDQITLLGIKELYEVAQRFKLREGLEFNPFLARGLNYYTGSIWEVILDWRNPINKNITIGSIASGGRYDNLTEMFGGQNMSGVGISFGIERIYDVMEELGLFDKLIEEGKLFSGVQVLFFPAKTKDQAEFEKFENFAFQQVQSLRDKGVSAELFLGNSKKEKQFDYAKNKNIAHLVEIGNDAIEKGEYSLRNAKVRETPQIFSFEKLIEHLQLL